MSRHVAALADYRARLLRRISNFQPELAAVENVKLPWFKVNNSADTQAADIYIYDEIGGSFGVQASELVEQINGITAPEILVHINSPGGDLFDSVAIYNALTKNAAHVTVYVDSLAASGASIITMAGDKRVMMRGSQIMIHDALAVMIGNAADFRAMATFLDRQSDNIADIYTARAGGNAADWRAKMLAETWMFAGEAVEANLADEIYNPANDSAAEDENVPDAVNAAVEDLVALMTRQHSLANRGFKYRGRNAAPAPSASAPAVPASLAERVALAASSDLDTNVNRMVDLFRKGIGA